MKKIIILIGVLVIIGVGIFAFIKYSHTVLAPKEQPVQTQSVIIEDKKITASTAPFSIAITYPFVAGQAGFNKKAEDIVQAELADFKKNSLANEAARQNQYDLEITYDKGLVDENTINIMFAVSNYEGGAHGAHYFVPLNYNLKTHQEISLADLFAGQPNYLKKISDYCIADLKKQMAAADYNYSDAAWLADGAGPKSENFQVFLINKDSVTFYFAEYQVAAYAAGSFEVIMPK